MDQILQRKTKHQKRTTFSDFCLELQKMKESSCLDKQVNEWFKSVASSHHNPRSVTAVHHDVTFSMVLPILIAWIIYFFQNRFEHEP